MAERDIKSEKEKVKQLLAKGREKVPYYSDYP